MNHEMTGTVKLIQEAQTFGSGFTKRELILIVDDGKYPQEISLEFVQDKVSLLDGIVEGCEATVTFDIRGREYNGKYFNNLQAWKIQTNASETPLDGSPVDPPTDFDEDMDVPF